MQTQITLEYLGMFDIVSAHLLEVFRDKNLPPNMLDTQAIRKASQEAMNLHRHNQLVTYYNRLKSGAV